MDSHRRHRPPSTTPHEGADASSAKLLKKPSFVVAIGGHRAASLTPTASDVWDLKDGVEADAVAESRFNNHRPHRDFVIEQPVPRLMVDLGPLVSSLSSEEDEKIVQSVVDGTIPSYSLECKLGDCTQVENVWDVRPDYHPRGGELGV